jgi:hypothetical protein
MSLIHPQAEFHPDPEDTARQWRHKLRREAGKLLPGERVASCGVKRVAEVVTLWRDSAGGCYWQGVETCGSIWTCPVCSAKIAAKRAEEVKALVQAHEKRGRAVYMATFTMRHSSRDKVAETRATVTKAWTRVQAGKAWKALKAKFHIMGTVRALEITYGANGWHPHLHVLFFTDRPLGDFMERRLASRLYERWQGIIDRLGGTTERSAFDFRKASDATTAAEYVAKWGAGYEIAKGPLKEAAGCSVWDLLKRSTNGDHLAGVLFMKYAKAFKGARHLTYSRGLRERYDLRDPAEDLDLALDGEGGGERVAPETGEVINTEAGALYTCDPPRWSFVCRMKATALLLDIAAEEGREGVERWFDNHHASSPIYPEDFGPKRPRREMRIYREALDRRTGARTGAEVAEKTKAIVRRADEEAAMREAFRRDPQAMFDEFDRLLNKLRR